MRCGTRKWAGKKVYTCAFSEADMSIEKLWNANACVLLFHSCLCVLLRGCMHACSAAHCGIMWLSHACLTCACYHDEKRHGEQDLKDGPGCRR